jgi:nucleoside-diphosphate-sugar epimerase
MHVLVTGGTGYVGSHTVRSLIDAGHQVRVAVRSRARVGPALEPLGIDLSALDVVTADATDPGAISRAMEGIEACVHAAAIFSWDPRRDEEIRSTNLAATRTVLGAALKAGCDPIVHVSSIVAILPERAGGWIDADAAVHTGPSPGAYVQSKADSERLARSYQSDGQPVVSVYPGAVIGPHDPNVGEMATVLRWYLRGLMPTLPKESLWFTDVRDVAQVVAATVTPGCGPRRFLVPGTRAPFTEVARIAGTMTGRRLPIAALSYRVIGPLTSAVGLAQRPLPSQIRYPADRAVVWTASREPHVDASATTATLGVAARPLRDSVEDEVRWLAATGLITPRHAGRLATGG